MALPARVFENQITDRDFLGLGTGHPKVFKSRTIHRLSVSDRGIFPAKVSESILKVQDVGQAVQPEKPDCRMGI